MPVTLVTSAEITADFQIVDARSTKNYGQGHLPGSRSLPWIDFTEERPGLWTLCFGRPRRWGRLLKGPGLETRLQSLGLDHGRPFLVVGSPDEVGAEGRTAWNLLCWGAQSVSILDGGLPPIRERALEKGFRPPERRGTFRVSLQHDRIADSTDVLRALEKRDRALLDVRTEAEFKGRRAFGQKRGGHLPGAELVPIHCLYEPDGRFISAQRLSKLVPAADRPITYCTGGVRSALLAMLLEARLGIQAANYDGSLWEWSANPALPLDK